MGKFKGWENLSANQRRRYELKGVTQQTYTDLATGKVKGNLTMQRGHGISLPHMAPVRRARAERARAKTLKALGKIQSEERELGYLTDQDLVYAMGAIGLQGAQYLVDWHHYKHSIAVKRSGGLDREGNPLPTFKEYITLFHGPDVWNDVWDDYWSTAQEIEGNGYYN